MAAKLGDVLQFVGTDHQNTLEYGRIPRGWRVGESSDIWGNLGEEQIIPTVVLNSGLEKPYFVISVEFRT
jgi:hypothetical protein